MALMKRVRIGITGTTGLLMDSPAGIYPKRGKDPRSAMEQATAKAWRDEDGRLAVPGEALWFCKLNGGKTVKCGKGNWSTGKTSRIPGAVDWQVGFAELRHSELVPDTQRIPNSAGSRSIVSRGLVHEWACEFEYDIDVEQMSPEECREIWEHAGIRVGLGCKRPERRGLNGKFAVTLFECDGTPVNAIRAKTKDTTADVGVAAEEPAYAAAGVKQNGKSRQKLGATAKTGMKRTSSR